MNDVVAIRMDMNFLKKIDQLGEEEIVDRSTLLRKFILRGYQEMLKERAAEKYKEGKITFSEAAYRAGLTFWDMERYLVDKGFKSDYSLDDFEEEINLLKKKKY